MSDTQDFLVEIGTEELPPKSLPKLIDSFKHNLISELADVHLSHHEVQAFAAPRRLALVVNLLETKQADKTVARTGPFKSSAYDDNGIATPAALGFAKSCGTTLEELSFTETDKGPRLFFEQHVKGKNALELLPKLVAKALSKLPVNKPMRWGNRDIKFVRPVHWVLMLLGDQVVPGELLEQTISNVTYGHRFHHPEKMVVAKPSDYASILEEKGYVIASFEKRRSAIKQQLVDIPESVVIDEDLLDEVTALVEWPVALKGSFDKRFLFVPEEALITTMKVNQKCFSLVDKNQKMLPQFVTISNIDSKDKERVIKGNERVIQARLSDAEFFYQQDIKHGLARNVERLKEVVFQAKLGTMFNKVERVQALAKFIAQQIKANVDHVQQAATLCKADLLTEMVGEFPDLQGTMGYYYAKNSGIDNSVAIAIRDHYLPRHAGDELPTDLDACALAIADKVDTLIGIFGINQAPTGVKDPYGLRRAAIGVLRIIIEKSLPIDLHDLLSFACDCYSVKLENDQVIEQCFNFIADRLKSYYSDRGISTDIFASVIARSPTKLLDFHYRIKAVENFKALPEAKSLAAANKRVSNILKKIDKDVSQFSLNENLLAEPAEKNLAAVLKENNDKIINYFADSNYTEALSQLASLQQPVDQFFDDVLVMSDDESLQNNRLALLNNLRNLFLKIADISLLQQN